eukprot:CAMPEP_0201570840 /NCGR_PEP_ID=MMETSP0190_2-20130828/13264_1 /ASSEMBLY_ACC=CAM_ASM_000263 /TAXON_ID=37353 /ORGANISM="Rosalina sp." /LENGTH=844 /DNA_ID=CAMNT_0047994797 /DNA_START=68 /DNA_END=2602 /DNA_ORIENTATION=-
MAEEYYKRYVHTFGYAPAQPGHLISFAKKHGGKVKFTDAKKVIKAKPDASGYVPPSNPDGSGSPLPAPVKSEEEKKQEKRETAKRYSSSKLEINPNQLAVEHKIVGRSKRASANRYAFLLNQLTSKGWQKDKALEALKQANGNVLLAEEGLLAGGSIKAGPDWSYSHGGNGIKDKINRFNQTGDDEPHALDGAKWIKRYRKDGTEIEEPQQSQRNGYKRKQSNQNQGQSQGQPQSYNNSNNNNASQGQQPQGVQSSNWGNNNQPNGVHYNGLLDFPNGNGNGQQSQGQPQNSQPNNNGQNASNHQSQFQGQSTGANYNNQGQNNQQQFQGQSTGSQYNNYGQNNNKSQFEQQSGGVQSNNHGNNNQQQFQGQSSGTQYNNQRQNGNNNSQFQGQSTGSQYNNQGQNGNNNQQQFQGQSTGAQNNNYGNNNQSQFQGQSTGSQYNNNQNNGGNNWQNQRQGGQYNNANNKQNQQNRWNQQPQKQTQQQPKKATEDPDDVNVSFERLLSGHASIKQRLQAMDNITIKLEELDISGDHGKVLLGCYTEQVLHEDYIYRDYAVRIKAIEQISDVFIYCLNRVHFQDIPTLVDQSLPEILDALYKLMDDNRARKFHDMCKQCISKIIDAIMGKRSKEATIGLCGYLNEKINCENITQAHPRFFTAKQLFPMLLFGKSSQIITKLFDIDINGWNNKIPEWKQGVNINESTDLPQDRQWFNLMIANNFNNNDDETFKDIITDCISIMILDPNPDMSLIGNNLAVFFSQHNNNFSNSLETEAKYRLKKFYVPQPKQTSTVTTHQAEPLRPLKPVENKNNYQKFKQQHAGEADHYRIKQETGVFIAAPTLPSI